jgi:hypothetical protein
MRRAGGAGQRAAARFVDTPMLHIAEAKPSPRCARFINSAFYRH